MIGETEHVFLLSSLARMCKINPMRRTLCSIVVCLVFSAFCQALVLLFVQHWDDTNAIDARDAVR
jgi:hypothetical protein